MSSEYLVYFSFISLRFIAGFTVLKFEISGLIRTSDDAGFDLVYIEVSAVPKECAIIIGFDILFFLMIDSRVLTKFFVSSEKLDNPCPGRSKDRTECPFDFISSAMKFRAV